MNTIITGNLTRDVELKYFESGKIKAVFSVACNIYNPKTKEQEPNYYNCEAWEKQAEFIAEKFKKGDKISLECVLKHETYKSKSGEDKETYILVARNVIYSGAYSVIMGEVEKEEKRFTGGNKQVQYVKLKDNSITVVNRNDKIDFEPKKCYTIFGTLKQTSDKKMLLEVVSIFNGNSEPKKEPVEETKTRVDFAEEEIPF